MIRSLYRIDLVTSAGEFRLVSIGDDLDEEIAMPVTIPASEYKAIGADWSDGQAEGGAKCALEIKAYKKHDSHQESRRYCLLHGHQLPKQGAATLRIEIFNPNGPNEVWERASARLLAATPVPALLNHFRTLTTYRIECGALRAVSGLNTFEGIPIAWITQPISSLAMPITSL